MESLKHIITYIINTVKRELELPWTKCWDGRKGFHFMIDGISDSEYTKNESYHHINSWST